VVFPIAVTVNLYVVLSAIDAYVEVVIVVDVPVMPDFVPSTDAPLESRIRTVYEEAFGTAAQETSTDLAVDGVAEAATEPGAVS
jgi:hypothetical protein